MPGSVKNVLLFLTDQQRKDSIGAYGNPIVRTPNVDRLAAKGTRFERAYCQNPFCTPSRASMLTGLYPRTHGAWNNGVPFAKVGAPTLGDILQQHGYRTGSVGKIHLNTWFASRAEPGHEENFNYWKSHPEMKGWHGPYCGFQDVEMAVGHVYYSTGHGHYGAYLDENFPEGRELFARENALLDQGFFETWRNAMPEEHHYNTWIARQTCEMVDRFAGEPFFIHCSFPDPHHPLSACEPYGSMYDPADMPEPIALSEGELEQMPPAYLDRHLGRKSSPWRGPSYAEGVEGAPLREMMAQMLGMVTHVDHCIGRVLEHLSARGLLDETLIIFSSDHGELMGDHGLLLKGPFYYQSLLNVPLIMRMPGAAPSVCPGLTAHVDMVPTALECLGLDVPDYLPGFSLRNCLDGLESPRDAVLTEFRPIADRNMTVLHTGDWKYVHYPGEPYGELFNLRNDPEEHHNLFGDPAFADIRAELRQRLLDELVRTNALWPECSPRE